MRIEGLVRRMDEHGLDLALLFDRDNIRYFTGFRLNRVVTSILAIPRTGDPTYIVAQLDLERAKRDCWMERIIPFPEDTPNYLAALVPLFEGPIRRIAVETDTVTVLQADYVKGLAGGKLELVDVRPLTTELRLIKTEEEIACLREAAAIADRAMGQLLKEVCPGVSEAELAARAEYLMRLEGAEGASFEAFLMSGENAWLPQRIASDRPLATGELAVLDMGAVFEGYSSDLTRTFAVGQVSAEQKRIFDVAAQAQRAAVDAVRPGVRACDVHAAACEIIEAQGLGAYFPHLTGHGVGVSTHEPPMLDHGVEMVLQPGMVTTLEPGVYVPGIGAARVEDMVLVTDSGCDVLTLTPRDLVR